MKKIVSIILAVVLTMSLGLTMVACGEKVEKETELNLFISGLAQPADKVFFNDFVKGFEKQFDVKVNVTYGSVEDGKKKVSSQIEGGVQDIDIVQVNTSMMPVFTEAGYISDISSIRKGLEGKSTITDMFDESIMRDGKTYFMPSNFDIYISAYNKKVLPYIPSTVKVEKDKNGNITKIKEITWEEFRDWSIASAKALGKGVTGFPMASNASQLLYPMGGLSLAYGAGAYPTVNTQGAKNGWDIISDMATGGAIIDKSILNEQSQPTELMKNESLLMVFGHMGPVGMAYSANPDRYVLGPGPSGSTGKAGSTATAWGYGIVKNAKNTDLSQKWLEYVVDPVKNYEYCIGNGGVMSPVLEVELAGDGSTADEVIAIGLEAMKNGVIVTGLPSANYQDWNLVKTIYTELYDALISSGKKLTLEELTVFQDKLNANLKK